VIGKVLVYRRGLDQALCVTSEEGNMHNPLFGEVLTEGFRSVKAKQNRDIRAIQAEIATALGYTSATVERWRRGYVPTTDKQIEFLAHYFTRNGNLSRQWLDRLLTQARYYDRQRLLDELCPDILQLALPQGPSHNLPPRSGEFLGREQDMAHILAGVASRWPVISIEGMGGIGKTTLAVEVAYACLPDGTAGFQNPFEACIFISAKPQPIVLNDLLDAIARVMGYPYIINGTPVSEKPGEVDRLLRSHRVLIIADNFETIADSQVLDYLLRIPEPSKVLITTRHGRVRRLWEAPLHGLPRDQALELVRRHAHRLRLLAVAEADAAKLEPLVAVTDGNPYALEMALGIMKVAQLDLDRLVTALCEAGSEVDEIFNYIFKHAWDLLSQETRHVLMAMLFFPESADKGAIGATVNLDGYPLDLIIGQLVEMSLLNRKDALEEINQRYSLHPLTLAFAGLQLRRQPDWEHEARHRWLKYWLEFAKTYADKDFENWTKYNIADNELLNLLSAYQWALDQRMAPLTYELFDAIDNLLFIRGLWEKHEQLARQGTELARATHDLQHLSQWLYKWAWSLIWRDRFDEAYPILIESIQVAQQHSAVVSLVNALEHMGVLLGRQRRYAEAEAHLNQAIELAQSNRLDREIVASWYHLGYLAFEQGDLDMAACWLEQVITLGCEIKWVRAQAYARNWLADIECKRGNTAQARQLLDQVWRVALNFKDQRRIAHFKRSLALVEEAEAQRETGLLHAQEALDLFARLGMQREINELMSIVHRLESMVA
jgi:tetratricopeptide (TPR) repeat protein